MTDGLFTRPEARANFSDCIMGLLAAVPRKNGWQLAAHAGHPTPDRQQNLLARSSWSADDLRDLVREQVVMYLGADQAPGDAVLVVDETAALKCGTKSVGVAYQYAGVTGQVERCQTMVMLTYAIAMPISTGLYTYRRAGPVIPSCAGRPGCHRASSSRPSRHWHPWARWKKGSVKSPMT